MFFSSAPEMIITKERSRTYRSVLPAVSCPDHVSPLEPGGGPDAWKELGQASGPSMGRAEPLKDTECPGDTVQAVRGFNLTETSRILRRRGCELERRGPQEMDSVQMRWRVRADFFEISCCTLPSYLIVPAARWAKERSEI